MRAKEQDCIDCADVVHDAQLHKLAYSRLEV